MDEALRAPSRSQVIASLASDVTLTLDNVTALWVGTGGTLVVRLAGDSADSTYTNVPGGQYWLGRVRIVRSTGNGTTAANLVAVSGYPKAG